MTQRQAAEAAGVSLATWEALERERHRGAFRDLTLSRVAATLGLPLEQVFAAAGRAWSAQSPAAETMAADRKPPPVEELVDEARQALIELHQRSEDDFLMLQRLVVELSVRLVSRHDHPDTRRGPPRRRK